jgi:transposase InsO family protein
MRRRLGAGRKRIADGNGVAGCLQAITGRADGEGMGTAADRPGGDVSVLAEFSEAQRQQAMARFAVLRPYLDEGVGLAQAAADSGVPYRTMQRWLAGYRAAGLGGLARKSRRDRGSRRFPEDLIVLIEGLALRRPPVSAAAIHRQVTQDHGWPVPAYDTVYDVVTCLDPALVVLAHEGTKRYREVFDLIHRREAERPNQIWQADHTQLDLWVRTPSGDPARPWLTVIEDDHSRAIAGYAVNLGTPSALTTALALRQAIWRKADPGWHVCGIPAVFYTDHGSDFTSRHLEQVAADLHIRLVFSLPGQPRGRGKIERYMNTINQMCLPELPGYAPRGTPTAASKPSSASVSSTRRSGRSSPASTTTKCTARPGSRRSNAGKPAVSCRSCPRVSSNWTCCCSPSPNPAPSTPTESTSSPCATSTRPWRPTSANP